MSTARDIERAMLERCLQIATTPGDMPRDQAEANVCRLAGIAGIQRLANDCLMRLRPTLT